MNVMPTAEYAVVNALMQGGFDYSNLSTQTLYKLMQMNPTEELMLLYANSVHKQVSGEEEPNVKDKSHFADEICPDKANSDECIAHAMKLQQRYANFGKVFLRHDEKVRQ
jgi:hypothetical protein